MHAVIARACAASTPVRCDAARVRRARAEPRRGGSAAAHAREPAADRQRSAASSCPTSSRAPSSTTGSISVLRGAPPTALGFRARGDFPARGARRRAQGTPAPFRLRPGLIAEILAFYDELRRRDKTVAAFDRLMTGSLESSADIDRGAERLLRLTRFLSAAFALFEARVP